MAFVKNDLFQVRIEDMSDTGEGIGKADGFTWFIKDAVIGDVVEAKVMKVKKSYGFARLMKVLQPSVHRVEPRCPVSRQCGGCQLQALDYEEQLRFKEKKICGNLQRIGGLANIVKVDEDGKPRDGQPEPAGQASDAVCIYPIIGMEEPWRYRNKAQFPFGTDQGGNVITGFYAGRTHTIIEQEDCLLGIAENKAILGCIKEYMKEFGLTAYDETTHRGLLRHVLIRKGFQTGELMVCLVINGGVNQLKSAEVLIKRLVGLFEHDGGDPCGGVRAKMTSISCSINREQTNVIMGKEVIHLYGPGYITDYIGNVKYQISPLSFYQVNPVQTECLYGTALEYAGLTGRETVWDLYCGIGTISLFLAQRAKKVYGVEIVPQAIEDARENAKINGIQNVEFYVGKAEEVLPELYEKSQVHADVIVVDPPRKGCDEKCLETIVKMQPERVVYVSCDSATLARDLKWLGERGYRVVKGRGVDMFPGSGHCEVCVEICRRQN